MATKLGIRVVADLKKRSKKGLDLAKQLMQKEIIDEPKLRDALEHYLSHWNDFTHPGLFSMACEAVGGNPDKVVLAQAAVAMMAAAFDIHDDIIDKSKVKHKIPTIYGKSGVEIALLLGDAFLIKGIKLLMDTFEMLPKKNAAEALEAVEQLTFEVGNAHALEISLKGREGVMPEEHIKITEKKAAGLELDMYLGALFGGGSDAEVEALKKLGRIIGILILLREEFIDIFEIEELYQRILLDDLPIPILFAFQDSKVQRKVKSIISKSKITQKDIDRLVDFTLEAMPVMKIKEKMQNLIEEGTIITSRLHNPRLRRKLQTFLSFMLEDL